MTKLRPLAQYANSSPGILLGHVRHPSPLDGTARKKKAFGPSPERVTVIPFSEQVQDKVAVRRLRQFFILPLPPPSMDALLARYGAFQF